MKIFKSRIFIFLLGVLITSGVVYAATTAAESISYGNGTVKDALDYLYSAPQIQKICEYQDSTYGDSNNIYSIGTKYRCRVNANDSYNFYVLAENNNNTLDLLMDRNLAGVSSWNAAAKYIDTNNIRTSWSNVLDVNLPSAQDIANAIGYNVVVTDTYTDTQICVNNLATSDCSQNTIGKNAWLYNYTANCASYGCDPQTQTSDSTAGYWTRDLYLSKNWGYTVLWRGVFYSTGITNANLGVRPVITVLKSNLYKSN